MNERILGIDPGTRYMGVVVLEGKTLLSYGVHTLRNGERPHDVIGQAKRIVLAYVARFGPKIVAYESPLPIATGRGAVLRVIGDELGHRGRELALAVRELEPARVRDRLLGNPQASKIDVAEHLVTHGFAALQGLVPQRPRKSALGLRPRDKYWLHMFDALAVAVASSRPPPLA
jgi:Holliday junction resolvasome RuvABC endonuclease subunit